MTQPNDVSSPAQLKQELMRTSQERLDQASGDRQALFSEETDVYDEQARAEIVAQEPALDSVLPVDFGAIDVAPPDGFDAMFEAIRSQVLGHLSGGADQFLAVTLQSAIALIDDLREVADEVAIEAAQMGVAADTGLLLPPTRDDLDDYADELTAAQEQARFVSRDLSNARARREARRSGRTVAISGPTVRTEDGDAFAAPGDARLDEGATSSPAAEQLQSMLRSSTMNRIGYIALCAAIASLSRAKNSRTKAAAAAARLKTIIDQIKSVLDEGFLGLLQESMQERANDAIAGVIDDIQSKLDAVDGFTKTIAGLPGPFVTTVTSIGDISDTAPLLNGLSTLCGIKGQRFCDFQGLLQIAASIDADLGLKFPRLPMVGRIKMTLVVDGADQVAPPVVVPGQEADLLLVETAPAGEQLLRAKFAAENRPSKTMPNGSTRERGDVFGDGPGTLTLTTGDGGLTEDVRYLSVSWTNGVHTFELESPLANDHEPWLLATPDGANLPGWSSTTTFEPDAPLRLRVTDRVRQSDIVFPSRVLIGNNESWTRNGGFTRPTTNHLRSSLQNDVGRRTFRSWHVGQTLTVEGLGYVIVSLTDGGDTGYDEVELDDNPPSTGVFSLSVSSAEALMLTGLALATPSIYVADLTPNPIKDHQRLVVTTARTVRVIPDVRADFLNPAMTPANGDVRDTQRILPIGATVLRASFNDPAQAAIFTPVLLGLGQGALSVSGGAQLSWSTVVDEGQGVMRFTLATPMPYPAQAGAPVEVETTSMLDQFKIDFPTDWSDPVDDWLRQILVLLNRIDSQFCRMLSGSNQDIAANCAAAAAAATAMSFSLTGIRFILVAWLAPLLISDSFNGQLAQLDAMGASRASQALREGRVNDFVSMRSADATTGGAAESQIEAVRENLRDEREFAAYAEAAAQVAGEHQSVLVAGLIAQDITVAQRQDLAAREQGAQRLKRLAEEIPV